jgi:hypothetical protein
LLRVQGRVASRGIPSPCSASRSAGIAALADLLARRSTAPPPVEEENTSAPPPPPLLLAEPSARLLGTVEAKARTHYTAAGDEQQLPPPPRRPPPPQYASGLREVLTALSRSLPGWSDLPRAVDSTALQVRGNRPC